MAHELAFMDDGRAAMAWVGETPWHGLGQQLSADADMETWRREAGMNFEIGRAIARFEYEDELHNVADKHILFRKDTKASLGIVSPSYQIVQPGMVLEFFRDTTEGMGLKLETAGVLFGGKKYWALARVTKNVAIKAMQDKVGMFLLLWTSADGTTATQWRWTVIRVVCNNTLSLAVGRGAAAHSITHRSAYDADAARLVLGLESQQAEAHFETAMDSFRRMAETKASPAMVMRMTLETLGFDPSQMTTKEVLEAAAKPNATAIGDMAISGRGLIGADMDGANGTVWGFLNAVTQHVDHNGSSKTASSRINSAWFGAGDKLKRRTFLVAQQHSGLSVTVPAAGELVDA